MHGAVRLGRRRRTQARLRRAVRQIRSRIPRRRSHDVRRTRVDNVRNRRSGIQRSSCRVRPAVLRQRRRQKRPRNSAASFYIFDEYERILEAARTVDEAAYESALRQPSPPRCAHAVRRGREAAHAESRSGDAAAARTAREPEAGRPHPAAQVLFASADACRARAIQELAAYQDRGTTQRYTHLSPAAIEAAIRLLETRSVDRLQGSGEIL